MMELHAATWFVIGFGLAWLSFVWAIGWVEAFGLLKRRRKDTP